MRISYRFAGITAWGIACFAGFCGLTFYDTTPGAPAVPAFRSGQNQGASLYVFLHPECPCSFATVEQLGHVLSQCGKPVRTFIVFSGPSASIGEDSDLGRKASELPDARLIADVKADLAHEMSAKTSGQVVYYDENGYLLFAGGVTATRGHVGANRGSDLLTRQIRGEEKAFESTPVFGCGLFNDGSPP